MIDADLLRRGRHPCPKCNRRGVGYAAHPHAFGWKDYDRASCRYCRARFAIRPARVDIRPKSPPGDADGVAR